MVRWTSITQHHPLSIGLYLYPFQTSHVLSSICPFSRVLPEKHHISALSEISSHVSASSETTSHKTVSRKTSHDTTQSPKKLEVSTSGLQLRHFLKSEKKHKVCTLKQCWNCDRLWELLKLDWIHFAIWCSYKPIASPPPNPQRKCGHLNEHGLHTLTRLNGWSLVSRTIWEGLGMWPCWRRYITGVWLWSFKGHARPSLPLSACCLWIRM